MPSESVNDPTTESAVKNEDEESSEVLPSTRASKRNVDGNPKDTDTPAGEATTSKSTAKPSPTSELKKQHAAVSLTQLFTNTQDSASPGTSDTLGEAGNFLAECFSGDGEGEQGNLAVDTNAAAASASAKKDGESTPTTENKVGGGKAFNSPAKKKAKVVPIKTEKGSEVAEEKVQPNPETPLALKAGAYRLNKLMEATKFTSPMPALPTAEQVQAAEDVAAISVQLEPQPQEPQKQEATVNRKEKSLGLLCQNFMSLCQDAPPCGENDEAGALVELNELATHLGVKRRRIYDIINIMESVHIVSRLKKNTYRWHGTDRLPLYFARLQKEGLEEIHAGILPDKPVKGMSLTCQKLIQYFLITGISEIRLMDAADAVLGPNNGDEEEKTYKTKIRRMYDIANVLTSLNIIKKENVAGHTAKAQPSFRWVFHVSPQDMHQHLPVEEQSTEPLVLLSPEMVPPPPQPPVEASGPVVAAPPAPQLPPMQDMPPPEAAPEPVEVKSEQNTKDVKVAPQEPAVEDSSETMVTI